MSGRLSAFVTGGLIGAIIGILFAPKTGQETRDDLKKRADELMEQSRETYETQRERVLEVVDAGKDTAVQRTEELKAKISDTRDKLKAQVDAAADSAKDKINSATEKVTEIKEARNDGPKAEPQE